jgi:hypothetical protein
MTSPSGLHWVTMETGFPYTIAPVAHGEPRQWQSVLAGRRRVECGDDPGEHLVSSDIDPLQKVPQTLQMIRDGARPNPLGLQVGATARMPRRSPPVGVPRYRPDNRLV